VLLTGVGVARWKAWPAVEKCLLKFSIIVDLSVVTVFPSLSAVGRWKEMLFFSMDFSVPELFKFVLQDANFCLLSYYGEMVLGEFLPFFADPLKLCQVGWGVLLHSYFQVSPKMLDWVQVQALAGPLEDIQRLVPKPMCCVGCVLRVIVLLEGEPSPQSEVLSHLEQVFIKDLCSMLRSSFLRS
jgi:hypothetical protein